MLRRFNTRRGRPLAAVLLGLLALPAAGQERPPPTPATPFEARIAAAEARLQQGDLEAALGHYRSALPEGWLLRGWLEAADGDLEEARQALERAAASGPNNVTALQALALAHLQTGEAEEAVRVLTRIVEQKGDDVGFRRLLAQAHIAAGHPERAVEELEAARAAAPDDLELAFALANGYLGEGRYAEAERLFAEVQEGRPIPQTRVLIGRAYRDAGEYDRARAEFRAALEQDPGVRRAHFYLAMTLLMDEGMSRVEDALLEFRKELEISPDDPATHLFLGAALVLAGRPREALPALEEAARSPSAPALAFFYLGRGLLALDRPAEAVEAERRALERAEWSSDVSLLRDIHYQLGLALRKAGERDAAAVHLGEAQRLSALGAERSRDYFQGELADAHFAEETPALGPALVPPALAALTPDERTALRGRVTEALARAHLNLGVIEMRGERFADAAELFAAAAELDPDFPQVQYSLGVARFNAGDFEEATGPLERARTSRPGDDDLRRMLAVAWLNTEAYAKAVELLRDDPGREADPSLQLSYGLALVRSGRAAAAEDAFSGLLARHGDSAQVNVFLGQAHLQQGDQEAALRALQRALELDPAVAEAHGTLGVLYLKQGRIEEAERALRVELRARPRDVKSRHHLAVALDLAGRPREALPVLRSLVEAEPDLVSARQLLGKILLAQAAAPEAVPHLEAAARLDPENAEVHFLLAQAYRELGRMEEAQGALETFRRLKDARASAP